MSVLKTVILLFCVVSFNVELHIR